jgi:hypothetical protein
MDHQAEPVGRQTRILEGTEQKATIADLVVSAVRVLSEAVPAGRTLLLQIAASLMPYRQLLLIPKLQEHAATRNSIRR